MEKQNLTKQKHAFTNQNKCTTAQNKHRKLKPGFVTSYDIRPGNGEVLFLISVLHKFVTYLLTLTLTHLLTAPDAHQAGWLVGV